MSATGCLSFGEKSRIPKNRMAVIEKWYNDNLNDKFHMNWGDPRLAIGSLPIAKLVTNITKEELMGIEEIISIEEVF